MKKCLLVLLGVILITGIFSTAQITTKASDFVIFFDYPFTLEQEPTAELTPEISPNILEAVIIPPNGVEIAIFVYNPETGKYIVDHKLSGITHKIVPIAVTSDEKLVFEEDGVTYYVAAGNTNLTINDVNNLPILDPQTGELVFVLDSYEYLSPDAQISIKNEQGLDVLIIDGVEYPTTQLKIDGEDLQSGIHTKYGYVGGENVVYFVGFEKRGEFVSYTDLDGTTKSVEIIVDLVCAIKWSNGKSYQVHFPFPVNGGISLRTSNGGSVSASIQTLMVSLNRGEELEVWALNWDDAMVKDWIDGLTNAGFSQVQIDQGIRYTMPTIAASRAYPDIVISNYNEYSSGREPNLNSDGAIEAASPRTIVH